MSVNVPTMDEFNALTARVTALESGGTHPPDPTKTPSPDGTTVTTIGPAVIDQLLRSFTLVAQDASNKGQQIAINGTRDTRTGLVVKLYAKGQQCYQQNQPGTWYVADGANPPNWNQTQDPTGGSVPPSGDVPPQAAAVGYNTLTLGPEVKLGTNWWGYDGANLRTNPDGSVTDIGGVPNHYNAHASSTHPVNGQIGGTAFGGGFYAEIEWSWPPPTAGYQNSDGWPSFWATTAEADSRYNVTRLPNDGNLEFDCVEAMNAGDSSEFNHGIIHWYGGQGALWSNNNSGMSGSTHLPAGLNPGTRHRIAWLWVPATATSKGYTKGFVNDQQVGNTYTWDKWGGGGTPGQPDCPPFSIQDAGHTQLIWGSGTKNPITVYAVRVYQKDKSHNIGTGN
jgi:hypothetical protein